MIGSAFKVIGFFFVCFLVLCIPVNGKPLFDHLFKASRPVGKVIAEKAEDSLDTGREFGEKLFSNSIPRTNRDEISLKNSSLSRANAAKVKNNSLVDDTYDAHSEQDKEALEKTIESY